MTWDWHDIKKETTTERSVRRGEQIRRIQGASGDRGIVANAKGPVKDSNLDTMESHELSENRKAMNDARKEKIVSAGKKVANVPKNIAQGVQSAGVKAIDRATKKPKASREVQDAIFERIKRGAEKYGRPIDYKAMKERQSKRYKDGRNPNLTYNKKGQTVAPVAQAAKVAGKAVAGKTVAAGKKAIGAGAKAIAAPFKAGARGIGHAFTGGQKTVSVHPSIEYDKSGKRNPNYDPKEAQRKKLQAEGKKPTINKPSKASPPPKPLPEKVKAQLKKPTDEQTTNPDFDV